QRFQQWAAKEQSARGADKFTSATYRGVRYMKSPSVEYAFLPGDRLVIASGGTPIGVARDLMKGHGTSVVESAASELLGRVGAAEGRGPALYSWSRLSEVERSQIGRIEAGAGAGRGRGA